MGGDSGIDTPILSHLVLCSTSSPAPPHSSLNTFYFLFFRSDILRVFRDCCISGNLASCEDLGWRLDWVAGWIRSDDKRWKRLGRPGGVENRDERYWQDGWVEGSGTYLLIITTPSLVLFRNDPIQTVHTIPKVIGE